MFMNKKNPIIEELKKLKLINQKNLIKISNSTRDNRSLKVYKDKISKIIFLEKYISTNSYYKNFKTKEVNLVKILNNKIKTYELNDDKRRYDSFKKYLKNKDLLDFGCGWGGFLNFAKNTKFKAGIELRKECIKFINKNLKKVKLFNSIEETDKKFDIITMFHVLEHLPKQLETLKKIQSLLKKNGKIIIEVPSANDILFDIDVNKSFKNFTLWSEHLILHTEKSLEKILKLAGFNNIKLIYYQRYNFNNHLGWFLHGKPGGHFFKKKFGDKKIISEYEKFLKRTKRTDTLIFLASKK